MSLFKKCMCATEFHNSYTVGIFHPVSYCKWCGKDLIDRDEDTYSRYLRSKQLPSVYISSNLKYHELNQTVQAELRDSIAHWAGERWARGQERSVSYREFYLTFGTDVISAQGLKAPEARKLNERIRAAL